MYLTRLIYFSETDPQNPADIETILNTARKTNAKYDISGVLWFDGDLFIQALEGRRAYVSEVYHRIARDARHKNIEIVSCHSISERSFGDWTMGYLANTAENREKIYKYSATKTLNPFEMSPDSYLGLLTELSRDGVD